MRVQVSARSGTITPNSSEPKRVRVSSPLCRKFLISWSIESPLAQPAGVSEPPWMLPGNSSTPVSRQPMPRMWLSPSPRTLSQTPCRISVRSAKRLERLEAFLERERSPLLRRARTVGHDAVGAEHHDQPLLAPAWLAKPRLGRLSMNGSAARADAQVAAEIRVGGKLRIGQFPWSLCLIDYRGCGGLWSGRQTRTDVGRQPANIESLASANGPAQFVGNASGPEGPRSAA